MGHGRTPDSSGSRTLCAHLRPGLRLFSAVCKFRVRITRIEARNVLYSKVKSSSSDLPELRRSHDLTSSRFAGVIRMNRLLIILMVAATAGTPVAAQSGDLQLSARPTITVPLGPELDDGTALYTTGGGVAVEGIYKPGGIPYLFTGVALDFSLVPINGSVQSATFVGAGPLVGLQFAPVPRLNLGIRGGGGLYMGIIEAGSIRDPYYDLGAFAAYRMNPEFSITFDAGYRDYLTSSDSALQGVTLGLGVRYAIGSKETGASIDYTPAIQPIYPLFYSYYDKNPAGTLTIVNNEPGTLKDLKVSFFVKQFMDQPKVCAEIDSLPRGVETSVPVYALFSEEIFRVTEGTKAAGELLLEYTHIGSRMSTTIPVTVVINNRNAMSWDDDRKAAAFVTAKDPLVLSFAKNVAATIGSDRSNAINETFRTAFGIYEALSLYGMGYVQDPNTPYAVLSEKSEAVDYLQFPNQSIAYKAGDCDDLSVLYCSLLEAVGIQTAFITAPGHIYMAFNLEMSETEAQQLFADTGELIIHEQSVWLPVEVTLVREGFLKSWQIGAKEWRETSLSGTGEFFPVREAWDLYEPVGFADSGAGVMLPDEGSLMERYRKEMITFINRQIEPRVLELRGQLSSAGRSIWARNQLGILYARFGVLDKAAEQFSAVINEADYVPAIVNLGNVSYLQGEMDLAYTYYQRALDDAPGNTGALLGLARASYELEKYGETDSALSRLQSMAPAIAAEFAYLGSGESEDGTGVTGVNTRSEFLG